MYRDFYPGGSKAPRGSVRVGNFFEMALDNMAQSMSQKMLRKSLTNGARKLLDSINRELITICNMGLTKAKTVKKKRQRKSEDHIEEMPDKEED